MQCKYGENSIILFLYGWRIETRRKQLLAEESMKVELCIAMDSFIYDILAGMHIYLIFSNFQKFAVVSPLS